MGALALVTTVLNQKSLTICNALSIWILTSESWFCQNICWFWIWGPSWLCWSIWETLWCCEAHQSTSCLLAFKKIINNWRLSLEMFKKKLKKNSGRNPKKNQEKIRKVHQSTSWLPSKRSSITEDSPSGQVAKYLLRSFKIQIYTVHDLEFWKCSTCQFARILSHSRSFSQKLWCIYRFQNTNNTISLFPQYLDREMLIVLELSLQQIFIFPKFKLKHDWTLLSLKELSCKVRVSRNKDIWSTSLLFCYRAKKQWKGGKLRMKFRIMQQQFIRKAMTPFERPPRSSCPWRFTWEYHENFPWEYHKDFRWEYHKDFPWEYH